MKLNCCLFPRHAGHHHFTSSCLIQYINSFLDFSLLTSLFLIFDQNTNNPEGHSSDSFFMDMFIFVSYELQGGSPQVIMQKLRNNLYLFSENFS